MSTVHPKLRVFHGVSKTLATLTKLRQRSTTTFTINSHLINNTSRKLFFSSQPAAVTSTPNSQRHSEYGRLLPCPSENNLPRNIEHLVVREGGSIRDFISKALDLSPLYVEDLIHFGAVHYALVCPKPPSSATQEEIRLYKEFTKPSVLRKRSSIKGKTVREAQNTSRITQIDQFVEAGTYVRVHVRPKRFPRCYEVDWRSRIIAVTDSYVVLDKPAGTSVGGTTDNIEETCANFATRALELTTPLLTTHQIDNCTEGCVVLARTKHYCSVFHRKIRDKQVKKLYLALAAAYVPIGVMTHYMRPNRKAPTVVSEGKHTIIFISSRKCICVLNNKAEWCKGRGHLSDFRRESMVQVKCGFLLKSKSCAFNIKNLLHAIQHGIDCLNQISSLQRISLTLRIDAFTKYPVKDWYLCQLEVIECRKVPWPCDVVEKKYGIEDLNWPNKEFAYECKINLLTGRTHQIRAQLAACGAPIVGDSMYIPAANSELATPGLNPFGKYKKQFESEADRECAAVEWGAKHGKEPSGAIGLQACQISWDEGEHVYQAGAPWWTR